MMYLVGDFKEKLEAASDVDVVIDENMPLRRFGAVLFNAGTLAIYLQKTIHFHVCNLSEPSELSPEGFVIATRAYEYRVGTKAKIQVQPASAFTSKSIEFGTLFKIPLKSHILSLDAIEVLWDMRHWGKVSPPDAPNDPTFRQK